MKQSAFLRLSWNDLGKGILVAFFTALLTGVLTGINTGDFQFTWTFFKPVVIASIGAILAYLLKNVFTSSEGKFLAREPKSVEIESNIKDTVD